MMTDYKDCKYNTSGGGYFVGYCNHPRNEHETYFALVECTKCPCKDFKKKQEEEEEE